ncbi:plasmid stability protein [Vandammella animalimorsus]|uniref:Plasmid stability protein n=1 Tax=Vandammella animalimorsus TaxID=2029117 RepID=A0A2A2T847_9BURK|nr:plasmid stability protein [Vandammella animalimorsus]PAT32734.1 plasmid stability protein [Vandammella animalimorsus]PAX17765.1 plasmid stability protein [Vandammella animalimorsus]PAX19919.1 plasmid stability protein [Vandammella animalimorsus]
MPATLTLKNIPDEIYERLKAAAQAHRRSLSNEAVVCLQTVLMPASASAEERLQRARALRQRLAGQDFAAADIAALRQEGRA